MSVRRYVRIGVGVAAVGVLGVGAAAVANNNSHSVRERLSGFEEVPAIVTTGSGTFRAFISTSDDAINYRLVFSGLESPVLQSHIHFENVTNNGPIVAFLCTNGTPPAGVVTPRCSEAADATSGTVEGTITSADVLAALPQGLEAGNFDDFVKAIRGGATYVNVHTSGHPGGEIRAQLENGN